MLIAGMSTALMSLYPSDRPTDLGTLMTTMR